jgi:hypothetical protein
VAAIAARRTVASNAPLVELTVDTADGGRARVGDTARVAPGAAVVVRVRAPSWAPIDRIALWSNGQKLGEVAVPSASATDAEARFPVSCARDCWVAAEVTGSASMFPVVPPTEIEPLDVAVLFRALAAGIDLGALPLVGKLRPDATEVLRPFAMTSPIWLDVDGGGFTPPRAPLPRRPASAERTRRTWPDVREQFLAAPGVRVGVGGAK